MTTALEHDFITAPHEGAQTKFLTSPADIIIYGGAAGGGKMLSLDTPIPTPNGWTTIGKIKPDDLIFDETGKVTNVVKVHPINDAPDSYRVVFDDGAEVLACADHLWLTLTASDLSALTRREDSWRSRRRSKRQSRATYGQGKYKSRLVSKRNKKHPPIKSPPPTGSVKTTKQIADTLRLKSGRKNHAIPVSGALDLPESILPLDPYLFGLWLGDGTSEEGSVTTVDSEIEQAFRDAGYTTTPRDRIRFTARGLVTTLRKMGVVGNKHVPAEYLRASRAQRLALLQGLMDTDGTACKSGSAEFTNTNFAIAQAAHELIVSLGWKVRLREGRAKIKGRDCGPKWTLKWMPSDKVFRLPRKRNQQTIAERRTTKYRYIVKCERVAPTPMRCITVSADSGLFLCGRDMVPTHNSAGLLLESIRHARNPRAGCVIFRRTYPQIFNEGSLWDTSHKIYPILGGKPREGDAEWIFPSGYKVKFAHLEHETSKKAWDGSQIPLLCFDELTSFSSETFWYMLSRNRSTAGLRPYVRCTTNPDADSWVADLIAWWIDQETGYAIRERSGVIRWFVRLDGQLNWFDTKRDAIDFLVGTGMQLEKAQAVPKSLTFILSLLEDNPTLEKRDPGYRANLMALEHVERERLLGGNWKIRPAMGLKFPRDKWDTRFTTAPDGMRYVRFWDKAGTSEEASKGKGARTAGVLMGEMDSARAATMGLPRYWIIHAAASRWGDAERESKIKSYAVADNKQYGHVTIGMETEPGSGGKHSSYTTLTNLSGFDVYAERPTTNKSARWGPLASQQQIGRVAIVKSSDWDWAAFINELDALAGDEKLDKGKLKDLADATAGAFKYLAPTGGSDVAGDMLASGDEDEYGELTEDEKAELPEYLRELIDSSDEIGDDRERGDALPWERD